MTSHPEIEGMEFDWFAADKAGNVALFATAGAGFVPQSVLTNLANHEDVSAGIESPHWGADQVWDDYAVLGLYVYDWALHGGPYRQMRKPTCNLDFQLKAKLIHLPLLPRLNVEFHSCPEISVWILENAT